MTLDRRVGIITLFVFELHAVQGIVGGDFANDGEFPFAAVIFKQHKVICGGVLVTLGYVFTGCHCVGEWRAGSATDDTTKWEPDQAAYDFNFTADNNRNLPSFTYQTVSYISHYPGDRRKMTAPGKSKMGSHTNSSSPSGRSKSPIYKGIIQKLLNPTSSGTRHLEKRQANTEPGVIGNNTRFSPFEVSDIFMVAGTVWIYKFSKGQLRKAGNSFKHPRCNALSVPWNYDFGIYRAGYPFDPDEIRLRPMTIFHRDNEIFRRRFESMIAGGEICQTIGWGATQLVDGPNPTAHTFNRTAANMSENLKMADVKLVTDALCNQLLCFPPYNFCNGSGFDWSEVGVVCAIHVGRGDSCNVDDGNALICAGHVFGFANSGLECNANVPRFYTRLDNALDFYYSSVNSGITFHLFRLFMIVTAIATVV